jgi:glucosamine-6-phosphate deaminase
MFSQLQHTITGWPGGKPNTDDSLIDLKEQPAKKASHSF